MTIDVLYNHFIRGNINAISFMLITFKVVSISWANKTLLLNITLPMYVTLQIEHLNYIKPSRCLDLESEMFVSILFRFCDMSFQS